MIKRKERISSFDNPLFSTINMDAPPENGLSLPSVAWVAYIIEGDGQTFSAPVGYILFAYTKTVTCKWNKPHFSNEHIL